jgi:hypothetical protein
VPDTSAKPRRPSRSVAQNVRRGTFLEPLTGNVFERVRHLKPGEREDFLYQVSERTERVFIDLSRFSATLPASQQNQLFGDDIFLTVHSAKTSAIGEGDYLVSTFTTNGSFIIEDPEPGLLRITVNGDTTNAGTVAVNVAIGSQKGPHDRFTTRGRIATGEVAVFPIEVPAGVSEAVFTARWRNNWSRYPTSDLDLILLDPGGGVNFDGATLDSPERVTIATPALGTWLAIIDGFDVPARSDTFELSVTLDGALVR